MYIKSIYYLFIYLLLDKFKIEQGILKDKFQNLFESLRNYQKAKIIFMEK